MRKSFQDILIEPIITEKSTALSGFSKYTFKVAKDATKHQIKKAFEEVFPNRKVQKIQTLKLMGHKRRTKRSFKPPHDLKKAVITTSGERIEYFPELTQ